MYIQTHSTFAYTHPTSHTNTLNHYHFILKQKKKSKDKTHPITKFQISSNKNINKNIKPNNNTIIKNLTIQISSQTYLKPTNILNHYHFVLKQIKKLKTINTPITKFQLILTKKIKKNIKLNQKNSHDKKPNNTYIYNIFLLFIKA